MWPKNISLQTFFYFILLCSLFLIFRLCLTQHDISTQQQLQKEKPSSLKLFPDQDPHSDRIINQLMYIPPNYEQIQASGKLKTILVYSGVRNWKLERGREVFQKAKCPVDTCELIGDRMYAPSADMVLFKDLHKPIYLKESTNPKQVSMLYYLESPYHTQKIKVPYLINWTSTYRRDSTIVAPYRKWQYYDTSIQQQEQPRNYAANKTKKIIWYVSNCNPANRRWIYAKELQRYMKVDIYGACGDLVCTTFKNEECYKIIENYKFYLAFENSNCKDYITEKLFVNALGHNALPIVMGAPPEDYEAVAPRNSYIHVEDFASPKELADYLHELDNNDELYNSYFKWKGTGELIDTKFWCRVCALLHNEGELNKPRWYPNIADWWGGRGVCTRTSWTIFKEILLLDSKTTRGTETDVTKA